VKSPLRNLIAVLIPTAITLSAALALAAVKSFASDGFKIGRSSPLNHDIWIASGLRGEHGQLEFQLRERIGVSSRMHNGPAIPLYIAGPPPPPYPPTPPRSLLNRLGFYWWTHQPLNRGITTTRWQPPYKIGAPAWFVFPLSLLLPIYSVLRAPKLWRTFVAPRRAADGHCPTCGYDCRATPSRCPECGQPT